MKAIMKVALGSPSGFIRQGRNKRFQAEKKIFQGGKR